VERAAAVVRKSRSRATRRALVRGAVAAALVLVGAGLWLLRSSPLPVESAGLRVSEAATSPAPAPPPAGRKAPNAVIAPPGAPPRKQQPVKKRRPPRATPPVATAVAEASAKDSVDTSLTAAPAPAPAPPNWETRAQVYLRIGLDEAAHQLGGPVHAIEGMSPMFIGLAPGHVFDGADTTRPVVRSVYLDPNGRLILLDQQRIRAGQVAPPTRRDRWPIGNVLVTLHGEVPPGTISNLRARVR
jgi:hypothetical protein